MTEILQSRVGVWSEVGRLRRVLVCAPGLAHLRLTPDTCDELLFDDVIWVDRAKRDHFEFVTKMRDHGVEVLETHELLTDILGMPEGRSWVLDRKVTDDLVGPGLTHELRGWLGDLPAARLAELLIGGVTWRDVPDDLGGAFVTALRDAPDQPGFVLPPLPNTLFARDNTSWIFGGVTLNPMYWPARRQETLLTTAIYRFHPAFADTSYDVWLGDPDGRAQDHGFATLEGGDVMPIGKGIVAIGMGERTSQQAITQVAQRLFKAGAAEQVIVASLPRARSAMHLDTVFTFCDADVVTTFAPVTDAIVPFTPAARRRCAVRHRHPAGEARLRADPGGGARCRPARGQHRWRHVRRPARAVGRRQQRRRPRARRGRRLRPQHLHQHRCCARPASRSSPSLPASSAGAVAVAAA